MRNQKGLTLIEVLATLTISMVVLGVAFLLYSSVNQLFHSSSQTYNDKASMNRTMNTMAKELTDATKFVYFSGQEELRYTNGSSYHSLWFDADAGTLTLYRFGEGRSTVEEDFSDAGITLATNAAWYSKPIRLSDIVNEINYMLLEDTPGPTGGQVYSAGEHLQVEVVFTYHRVTAGGGKIPGNHIEQTVIKLMEDDTSK
jgi:Tfp pilus assembly protein PilV